MSRMPGLQILYQLENIWAQQLFGKQLQNLFVDIISLFRP
ncbi:unnamed protein product [Nezara viridula]|uniref:Uncharacterized protein n=1 Tax=Nezara viridula TaxID=85310 RepID=A0A9P0MLR3_NEZVI|nr:unnamed protein product [Nezara viridula]